MRSSGIRCKRLATPAPVTARAVVRRQARHHAYVAIGERAQEYPTQRPVHHADAVEIPRADHQVVGLPSQPPAREDTPGRATGPRPSGKSDRRPFARVPVSGRRRTNVRDLALLSDAAPQPGRGVRVRAHRRLVPFRLVSRRPPRGRGNLRARGRPSPAAAGCRARCTSA